MSRTWRESSANQPACIRVSVKVTDCLEWRFLNVGNPAGRPWRAPLLDWEKFFRATEALVTPQRKACIVTSWCHGATSSFSAFHSGVRVNGDQLRDLVRSASSIPDVRSWDRVSRFSFTLAMAQL